LYYVAVGNNNGIIIVINTFIFALRSMPLSDVVVKSWISKSELMSG